MEYRFSKRNKKVVAVIITSSFVLTNFLPIFTPRAEAFLGIGDVTFTINVKEIVRNIIDGIAMNLAQKMMDDMVQSSVKWANDGFEGSPSFVTNPVGHFGNIADSVAGDFIKGSDLGFLCSPYQTSVRLSLQVKYGGGLGSGRKYRPQCTVTGITGNIEDFYKNFNNGGWDTWFSMTQNNSNNPWGAYIDADTELDRRIASALGVEDKKLSWGDGFKSKGDCLAYNPSAEEIDQLITDYPGGTPPGYDPAFGPGECIKRGEDKTPGVVIKDQLNKVLPAGLEKLISVQHVEQLVTAFASGVLKRYVFSSKGLAGNDYTSETYLKEAIDLDGDRVPEGFDEDDDGQIDNCNHGIIDRTKPASNDNCQGSRTAVNSPYYIKICQATEGTSRTLETYLEFLERNTFQEEYANTWMNRTLLAADSVDRLEGTLSQYEDMAYDPVMFRLGKYTKYTGKIVQSLAKDEDLKDRGFIDWDFGGGSTKNSSEQNLLIKNTRNILNYVKNFRVAIGDCDNPNKAAISNLVPPEIDDRVPPTPPDGWELCAIEGDYCVVPGTVTVRYGTGTDYIERIVTDGIACTNEAFGSDPAVDIIKVCIYQIPGSTPTNPNPEDPYVPPDQQGPVAPI